MTNDAQGPLSEPEESALTEALRADTDRQIEELGYDGIRKALLSDRVGDVVDVGWLAAVYIERQVTKLVALQVAVKHVLDSVDPMDGFVGKKRLVSAPALLKLWKVHEEQTRRD